MLARANATMASRRVLRLPGHPTRVDGPVRVSPSQSESQSAVGRARRGAGVRQACRRPGQPESRQCPCCVRVGVTPRLWGPATAAARPPAPAARAVQCTAPSRRAQGEVSPRGRPHAGACAGLASRSGWADPAHPGWADPAHPGWALGGRRLETGADIKHLFLRPSTARGPDRGGGRWGGAPCARLRRTGRGG